MKTVASIVVALACALPLAAQEEAVVEQSPTAARAARAAQRKLDADRRAKEAIEGKPLVYGGFLTELKKSEDKKKFLSLRRPVDPGKDDENVYRDVRTAKPKGFVLFSIGF